VSSVDPAGPAPVAASEDNEDQVAKQREFDARMAELRDAQNLRDPNAVPEQRPIASQTVDDPHSRVYNELKEAGDPRANDEPMDRAAYQRAASVSQARKAEKESRGVVRLFPGARVYIDQEGHPDHGRAAAVNRVVSWASPEDALMAQLGGTEGNFAQPAEYEIMTRDGRAEMLIKSADHLRPAEGSGVDWNRTTIM
jgi:hypothetical protein